MHSQTRFSEATKQERIRDAYNQIEADGVKILKTGKIDSVLRHWSDTQIRNDPDRFRSAVQAALNTEQGERFLKGLLTSGACQSMPAARQAVLHELEHRHPYLHEDEPVAAAVSLALSGYRFRFYTNTYEDNEALVAYIVHKRRNPNRSDYSKMILDIVVAKMKSVPPPAGTEPGLTGNDAANDILNAKANESYVKAVVAAYDEAVETTSGKTDTQLGLAADHVSYR